jgi:hypothetical protein
VLANADLSFDLGPTPEQQKNRIVYRVVRAMMTPAEREAEDQFRRMPRAEFWAPH